VQKTQRESKIELERERESAAAAEQLTASFAVSIASSKDSEWLAKKLHLFIRAQVEITIDYVSSLEGKTSSMAN
jgi:hypothetical protein